MSSYLPSAISLKPFTVSFTATNFPGVPVNCSATKKGWDREPLYLSRPHDHKLILFGKLVHAEDGDYVLKVFVLLQYLLDFSRGRVVLFADYARLQNARGGIERINRRVYAELGYLPRKNRRRVEMREGRGRSRVRQIVRRHVYGLHRGNRAFCRRGNPLLQLSD